MSFLASPVRAQKVFKAPSFMIKPVSLNRRLSITQTCRGSKVHRSNERVLPCIGSILQTKSSTSPTSPLTGQSNEKSMDVVQGEFHCSVLQPAAPTSTRLHRLPTSRRPGASSQPFERGGSVILHNVFQLTQLSGTSGRSQILRHRALIIAGLAGTHVRHSAE